MGRSASSRGYLPGIALALAIGAAAPGAHAQQVAGTQGAGAQDIRAGMQVTVAADGSVVGVVPDAALPEPIRAGLVKRVSQWHYEVPMWQGRPASISMRQGLRLQAVPTTSGGYALRVMGEAYAPDPDPRYVMQPPDYPAWLRRKNISASLAYAIRIGTDGRPVDVRRRYPDGPQDAAGTAFDESARAAIALWLWHPHMVDGTPVACDILLPMDFVVDGDEPPAAPDRKSLEAGLQLCPKPALETRIEGALL